LQPKPLGFKLAPVMKAAALVKFGCALLIGRFLAGGGCAAADWNIGTAPQATNLTSQGTKASFLASGAGASEGNSPRGFASTNANEQELQRLQKAADSGQTEAQLLLGTYYLDGIVVPKDLSKARALLENAAFSGNAQAHGFCTWMVDHYTKDRLWIAAKVNGTPARFILDSGSPAWILFPEAAHRLGVQIVRPIPDVTPPLGTVAFGKTAESALEVGGKALQTPFLLVKAGVEGDGVCGWPAFSDNIFLLDATSRQLVALEKVPEETASWLKLGVDTNSDYLIADHLILEIPTEGTNKLAVGIDTGATDGAAFSPRSWRQWRAAHPNQPLTLNPHKAVGSGSTAKEEGWADRLSFGSLTLTGVPVRHADASEMFSGAPGYAATLGLAALKRLDLIVDGKRGVAYARPKAALSPPYQHNRLGAVFVQRDSSSPQLFAEVADGSPAYDAGIRNDDMLLKVGQVEAASWRTNVGLAALVTIWNRPAGTRFGLSLKRGEKTFTTQVVLRDILPPEPLDSQPGPGVAAMRIEQHCLGLLPEQLNRPVPSDDGCHLAWVVERDGQWSVAVDGKEDPPCDVISDGSPVFSPNGRRVAYLAFRAGKGLVVLNAHPGPAYDKIALDSLKFSPDSKHVVYVASNNNSLAVVLDGQPSGGYENIVSGSLLFSKDGNHFAYVVKQGTGCAVVTDGHLGPVYDGCKNLVFSRTGRLAYAGGSNGKLFVVVDGKKEADYEGIGKDSLSFSPGGKHVAYAAEHGTNWFMVVDGKPEASQEGIGGGSCFSPDGRRLAYIAHRKGHQVVVVDGKAGPEFDGIASTNLVFSHDSRHLAYSVMQEGKVMFVLDGRIGPAYDGIAPERTVFSPNSARWAYVAQKGKKQVVVLDGQEQREYDGIQGDTPIFSTDSRHVVFVAKQAQGVCVVVDGQEGPEYDGISAVSSVLVPDGTPKAYLARRGHKRLVVTAGKPGNEYDSVSANSPIVSPDAKHMAYIATANSREQVFLDGQPGPHYDWVVKNGPTFRKDNSLEYLAVRDGALFRVKLSLDPVSSGSPRYSQTQRP
jgi:Tol biopolymer transport system component